MGFFSWNCKCCEHPLLSRHSANQTNAWMIHGVVITKRGRLIEGGYDGYGRLDGVDIPSGQLDWDEGTGHPDCYHRACWTKAGSPLKYRGGSEPSADQGYFFAQGAHDMEEPK